MSVCRDVEHPKNPFGEIAALVEAAAEVVGTISQKLSKPKRQDADSQRQSARTGGGGELSAGWWS